MTKLLLVDDDEKIRKIMKNQLKGYPVQVFEAKEGLDAIILLQKQSMHIVICDIKMKESNGIEILVRLRREYPDIPVIMITGFVDKYYFDEVKMLGGFKLLTKPVKRDELVKTIEEALRIELIPNGVESET
jgi:two-component system, NtrC family, response regulator HydG